MSGLAESLSHAPGVSGDGPAAAQPPRRSRGLPYLLLLPALLWLAVFFLVPMVTLFGTSLQTGSFAQGFQQTFTFANYPEAWGRFWPQMLRSLVYASIATGVSLVIAYPLAYTIAFKAGRWRNLLLILVVAPFFTSFLIRTLAWKTILADNSIVVEVMNTLRITDVLSFVGLTIGDRVLATPLAVITGLVYNFLPFMVLPLFASLDRLDPRLVEAASDLYASPFTAFRKLSLIHI